MNRDASYLFVLSLCCALLLTACKKERTLEADITMVNAEDDSPISGAKVIYEYQSQSSSEVIKEEVGTTDGDGKFHFSRKIAQFDTYTKLRIFADGYENLYTNGVEIGLNAGFDNTVEKKVYPSYLFSFSLKNAACFNETDSIWVSDIYTYQPYPILFTGCVDTTLSFINQYPFTEWSYLKNKTLTFKVKRNGVVTTSQQQVSFLFNQITPVHIVL